MKITIIAHPNSKKPRIETDLFGSLHIYVAEPAQDGKANAAIILALAKHFDVAKSKIRLVGGVKSK